ncbi:MAG: putative dsRNA-binding protein, partial [Candidatus Dormibacteraeota bacterium]|nr:putative dsRNA-binding protein [Candidatus Dormibacteraeota bacterium]
VLQLITAEYLYKHHPGASEGELTQTRSAMVNTNTLALLAEQLDMGSYLYLGKGIAKGGGRNLKSLLANMFEAVLGAVFLDAGYDAAYHYYLNRYRSLPSPAQDENFKGRLQQVAQERFGATPFYDSEGARVGNHREYTSVVFAGAEPLGTGHGPTKQEAEQEAARAALQALVGTAGPAGGPKPVKTPRPRAQRTPRAQSAVIATPALKAPPEPVPLVHEAPAELVPLVHEPPAEPVPIPAEEPVEVASPVPDPVSVAAPESAPSPPRRSRQFGEPLE